MQSNTKSNSQRSIFGFSDFYASLGKYVVYYPALAELTGTVNSAIFLSLFLGWQGKGKDAEGWIYKSQAEILEETGLKKDAQESARKHLKKRQFLKEKYAGIPRKLYYFLNLDIINTAWEDRLTNNKYEQYQHNTVSTSYCSGKTPRQGIVDGYDKQRVIAAANTSTTTSTEQRQPEVVTEENLIEKIKRIVVNTKFESVQNAYILEIGKKYDTHKIINTIDILTHQYRFSAKVVQSPERLISKALRNGIEPPPDYVSLDARQVKAHQKAAEKVKIERMLEVEKAEMEKVRTEFAALGKELQRTYIDTARMQLPKNIILSDVILTETAMTIFKEARCKNF
jgi:hypothetical protein